MKKVKLKQMIIVFIIAVFMISGCSNTEPAGVDENEIDSDQMDTEEVQVSEEELEQNDVKLEHDFERVQRLDLNGWEYMLTFPEDYNPNSSESWPLIVYLHGSGHNLDQLENFGVYKSLDDQDFSFITLSPTTTTVGWTNEEMATDVVSLIKEVSENYPVDTKRTYLIGFSLGAYGTFYMAEHQPELFAAFVPIAGGGETASAETLVDLPMWVFHNEFDRTVRPVESEKMVDAIKEAGGERVKLTIFPEEGHNVQPFVFGSPDLFEWLLEQSLE